PAIPRRPSSTDVPYTTLFRSSVFQWDFDLTVLAAVMAAAGYSLNDSIVVFDRIRENFLRIRKAMPWDIINGAINQTLSRTIITSDRKSTRLNSSHVKISYAVL